MGKDIEGRVRVRASKVLPQNLSAGNGENHALRHNDRPAGQYWSIEISESVALLKLVSSIKQTSGSWPIILK